MSDIGQHSDTDQMVAVAPATPNLRLEVGSAATSPKVRRTVYERLAKRPFDVILACALIVILMPVYVLISVVVLLHLGRPVFFTQTRVGRGGEKFAMLKFRTMKHDRRRSRDNFSGDDRRCLHKCDTDPRHTRVGRFLRSTSLDELPQLAQVVIGDLSLVGPRPEIWAEAEETGRLGLSRERVRPGITGPWQVYSRDSTDVEGRLRYDDRYVEEITLRGDLTLLARTAASVLNRTGR